MHKRTKEPTGPRSAEMDLGWVDLNTSTEDDLANIPWLGHELAHRIIEHRPLATMDDVRHIPGMSEDIIDTLVRGGAVVGNPAPLPNRR